MHWELENMVLHFVIAINAIIWLARDDINRAVIFLIQDDVLQGENREYCSNLVKKIFNKFRCWNLGANTAY